MFGVPELRSQLRYFDGPLGAFDAPCLDAVPAVLCELGPADVNHPN